MTAKLFVASRSNGKWTAVGCLVGLSCRAAAEGRDSSGHKCGSPESRHVNLANSCLTSIRYSLFLI